MPPSSPPPPRFYKHGCLHLFHYLDQNWTFQARLNEGDMEQLFYFVLLQKTLKSCLVVMNSITLPEIHDLNIDAEV